MAFRVTAPQIVAHDMGGNALYYLRNQLIPWLKPDKRDHLIKMGLVAEVPDPVAPEGAVPDTPAVQPTPQGAASMERPAPTALKETWVAYVVASGAASEQEAQQLTKDQLIQLVS